MIQFSMLGRVLAVLSLLVALAAGCGGGGQSVADIVSQSANKTGAVKSFHVVLTIDNVPAAKTGISLTYLNGDLAVPGSLRAKISGTFNGVPLSSELIVVGGKTYVKEPFGNVWHVVSTSRNPIAFFDPAKGVLAVIKGASDVMKDDSEDVGGVASYRLRARVRADALTSLLGNPPSAMIVPVELWIGKRDLLLRRIRLTGSVSPTEPKDAVRTIEASAFNEAVRITPPAATS